MLGILRHLLSDLLLVLIVLLLFKERMLVILFKERMLVILLVLVGVARNLRKVFRFVKRVFIGSILGTEIV